jgi:GT2 family glycosyltransferase
MLDADDAWEPAYLEKMLGALEQDPDLAFCSCDAFTFETDRVPGNRCSENTSMAPPVTLERVASRDFQVYTSVSLRRSWFDRVGGFDVDLRNAQDFDLWLRILAAGGRAAYLDEPLAWYRRTPGSLSSNAIRLSEYTVRVYEKLAAMRPELELLCAEMISNGRHAIALNKAKLALREGRLAAFQEEAATALSLERNFKLAAAVRLARLSPFLARLLFSDPDATPRQADKLPE